MLGKTYEAKWGFIGNILKNTFGNTLGTQKNPKMILMGSKGLNKQKDHTL